MFGTVMKHEIRGTSNGLGVIAGASVGVFATGALMAWLFDALLVPGLVLGILAVAALPLGSMIYLLYSYYQTMVGRIGYFTMSLPVRGRVVYAAKVTWAMIVVLVTYALSAGGLLVLRELSGSGPPLSELLAAMLDMGATPIVVTVVLIVVAQALLLVVQGAFVVSYGSTTRFAHMGIGGPVVVGAVTYLVSQVVVLAAIVFVPLGIVVKGPGFGTIVGQGMLSMMGSTRPAVEVLGLGMLPAFALLGAVCIVWTIRSIERHTSLR